MRQRIEPAVPAPLRDTLRDASALADLGDRLPIRRNIWIGTAAPTLGNPKSGRGCARLAIGPRRMDLPPKPKWMRWATYNRYSERYDHYEDILDFGLRGTCCKISLKIISVEINDGVQVSQEILIRVEHGA
jgi:hypothetical protein